MAPCPCGKAGGRCVGGRRECARLRNGARSTPKVVQQCSGSVVRGVICRPSARALPKCCVPVTSPKCHMVWYRRQRIYVENVQNLPRRPPRFGCVCVQASKNASRMEVDPSCTLMTPSRMGGGTPLPEPPANAAQHCSRKEVQWVRGWGAGGKARGACLPAPVPMFEGRLGAGAAGRCFMLPAASPTGPPPAHASCPASSVPAKCPPLTTCFA